jgi:hypothetical protein
MDNHLLPNLAQTLRLGIDAARAGHHRQARDSFVAVLKQDPQNIPAMLWLAFVLPAPKDTIRVLERVLALDPANEQAQTGLRWARSRQQLAAAAAQTQAMPVYPPEPASKTFEPPRRQPLSTQRPRQTKKEAPAHRPQRNLRPLLALLMVVGVLAGTSLGWGALSTMPPNTLAAWLPAATVNRPPEPAPAKTLVSLSDTLPAGVSAPAADAPPAPEPETLPVDLPPTATPVQVPILTGVVLTDLMGPVPFLPQPEIPTPADNLLLAYQPTYPGEKWIEVNVSTQQVTAWEGNVPVFTFTASTGLPNTPTVLGTYNIYWKLESTLMTGPGYYLPDVPYTMYFYGGYALHGTYWHDNFGQPMSHGCVNLETGNAQKLFEWAAPLLPPGQTQVVTTAANPGTLVVVHQ